MSPKTGPISVEHNKSAQRFEAQAGAHLAILCYTLKGVTIVFEHSMVPDELRGQGVATALARTALCYARDNHWTVVPLCSFVAAFIQRNPEFSGLLGPSA
jgi:predicted GNAT family acetyltransferase